MADKPKSGLLQRLGSGFDRYIGGLLGEDLESMTPEERANARRQAIGAIGRSMMDPASASEQYGAVVQARAQQRARGELARRTAAAEAMMPDVASRIFGGTGGRSIEALPGVGGEAMPMTARRVPTREGAREALGMLYGTQEGRDAATMAPDLAKFATEGVTGRTVGGSVYNPLTDRFTAPPKAGTTTLTPAEVRQLGAPAGTIIQRDADGKLSVLSVPRAAGSGGAPMAAGGAPGGAPASGAGRLRNLLTVDELRAANLPEGTVAQFDPKSGKVNVISSVPSTQRVSTEGKERAVRRIEASSELLQKQLDRVSTGGFLGITGAVGRVFDSQDARQFETFKEQLSSGLRSALRIPGEGALSDREQAQYGLTLPSLGMSKERNIEIMRALEDQVRLAADLPTLGDEKPDGILSEEWLMMLPSERAEFKRAGAK